MGGGPLALLPAALSIGGKLMGGSAQAAPAAGGVNPLSAGLMSPPMPERNPNFSDPAGDAAGMKTLQESPMLQNLFKQDADRQAAANTRRDSAESFENKPWTTQTVQGSLMDPAAPQPPKGNQAAMAAPAPASLMDEPESGPVQAKTASASPAPVRIDLAGENASRGMGFDTGAPSAPGAAPAASAPSLMDDPLKFIQGKLKGAPTNPLMQTGFSLLSSGYDGSNPYANIQSSLGKIPGYELAAAAGQRAKDKDEREAKEAKDQLELALMLQAIGGQYANPNTEGTSRVARGAAKVIR